MTYIYCVSFRFDRIYLLYFGGLRCFSLRKKLLKLYPVGVTGNAFLDR